MPALNVLPDEDLENPSTTAWGTPNELTFAAAINQAVNQIDSEFKFHFGSRLENWSCRSKPLVDWKLESYQTDQGVNVWMGHEQVFSSQIVDWRGQREVIPEPLLGSVILWKTELDKILSLNEDWDEEGAAKPDVHIAVATFKVLVQYAREAFDRYHSILLDPIISVRPDASIDLLWENLKGEMLMNIRTEDGERRAFFFGRIQPTKEPIKGHIVVGNIHQYLVCWLIQLSEVKTLTFHELANRSHWR